jgi:hypothetical protein
MTSWLESRNTDAPQGNGAQALECKGGSSELQLPPGNHILWLNA